MEMTVDYLKTLLIEAAREVCDTLHGGDGPLSAEEMKQVVLDVSQKFDAETNEMDLGLVCIGELVCDHSNDLTLFADAIIESDTELWDMVVAKKARVALSQSGFMFTKHFGDEEVDAVELATHRAISSGGRDGICLQHFLYEIPACG